MKIGGGPIGGSPNYDGQREESNTYIKLELSGKVFKRCGHGEELIEKGAKRFENWV